MKKIFFFDIDGTIYSQTNKLITQKTIDALLTLKQNGHLVCLCTGRGVAHSLDFIDLIKPNYFIGLNGNIILDEFKNVIHQNYIKTEDFQELVEFSNKNNVIYSSTNGFDAGYSKSSEQLISAFTYGHLLELAIVDPEFHLKNQISMGWLVFDIASEQRLLNEFITNFPKFNFIKWHEYSVDVILNNISKKNGIEVLLDKLQFTKENTIAFGDGLNDIEMIEYVNLGIAMGNAQDELKSKANIVIKSVEEDGVYNYLKESNLI